MTRRRKLRTVKEDERALWDRVATSARPLDRDGMRTALSHSGDPVPAPDDPKAPTAPPAPQPIAPFTLGARAAGQGGSSMTYAPAPGDGHVHMDRKAFNRMKRGKLTPEARIDLHGMTLARAHPALIGFVSEAHRSGLRLVLVITGKGRDRDGGGPIPERRGVLRHQVPDWLRMAPLAPLVLQVTAASRRHGGEGAWYVYLRRGR